MQKAKLLSKAPCNNDLFEGNAHKRLSEVIAEEIINDNNCSIIGIDGGWGSGKSNLVGMVEKYLTDESKPELLGRYHFFTYDAWGHQNDLPRRSILEELTSKITFGEDPILNSNDWKVRLDNLLAKKKKTTTKTVPSLNFAMVVMALLVALTPVISAISENIPTAEGKFIFTCLVYFIAIGFVVCKQIQNMKKHNQSINCENFFTELFLLYKDKITEDEKFETISEREPSTKQFKEWMHDIDSDLIKRGKCLIVVIDNMDRLPKLKVQELWSAIHSFFSEEKYSNIRVIVPFDRLHIRNAFHSEDIIKSDNNAESVDVAVYGDDFINKTFYVVYNVPPPILSGWKQYFVMQWKSAFGQDAEVDSAVLQIYDLMTEEHSPRKIVAFINEFVTIKSMSDVAIPDKYIALFVFGKPYITKKPIDEILSPSYLGSLSFLYKDDANMPSFISSLFYQLPVEDAVDVVFSRRFTKELDDNSPEGILKMKETGVAKFYSIIERSIAGVSNIENATLAIDSVFGSDESNSINNIWNCLYQKSKALKTETVVTEFLPYHKVMLTHVNQKSEYWKTLIRGYHSSLSENSDINKYVSGIDELADVKEVDTYGILGKMKKTVMPKQFISIVESQKSSYTKYGLTCDNQQLSDYLSALTTDEWSSLKALPFLNKEEFPFTSFIEKLEEELSASPLDANKAEIIFSRLKEISKQLIGYSKYFNGTKLDQLYNSASENFKADCLAMRLSSFNSFSSSYRFLDSTLNKPDNDIIEAVSNTVHNYVSYGDLLLNIDSFSNPLVKGVLKKLTSGSNNIQSMSILAVAKKFDVIVAHSEISQDDLFVRMNDWEKYKDRISLQDIPSLPIEFYEAANDNSCELSDYILDLVGQYLKSMTQDDWLSSMEANSTNSKLLKVHHPEPLPAFFDAFKQWMKEYATGESDESLEIGTVDEKIAIAESMGFDVAKLFRDIRDCFLSTPITLPKLRYFGHWLFKYGNLPQKNGCLEKILPTEMLNDSTVMYFIKQNKEVVKGMMNKSLDSSEFESSMRSKLLGSNSQDAEFKDLCDFLGISEEQDDEEDEG